MSTTVVLCLMATLLMSARAQLPEYCKLSSEKGPCTGENQRYFYDAKSRECKTFTYGGCEGNKNRFGSKQGCVDSCKKYDTDINENFCLLQPFTGPCRAAMPRYFYNITTAQCEKFTYGGCCGNNNRFETQTECQQKCQDTEPSFPCDLPNLCKLPADGGSGVGRIPKYHFNITSRKCELFFYGGRCGNDNRFDTKNECEIKCRIPVFLPPKNICFLQHDAGPCDAFFPRFYYNINSDNCEIFTYGGCGGNDNKFTTIQECQNKCEDIAFCPF